MAFFNPFKVAKRLRQIGLVGIGQRNAHYVLMHNPRKFYPRVDDKLLTKKLAIKAGLPVPDLYAVVREEHEIAELHKKLEGRDSFVVKPAHGSGGLREWLSGDSVRHRIQRPRHAQPPAARQVPRAASAA